MNKKKRLTTYEEVMRNVDRIIREQEAEIDRMKKEERLCVGLEKK